MKKVLLVEDDQSLQEIYGVRLQHEGYRVFTASDGEEALATALKERPDLILSDVMMPKISGFDMLDILRTTPEIKNTRVIIMTALSSDDQRARGEALGADMYLVKSQVGIEDIIQAVKTVLNEPEPQPETPLADAEVTNESIVQATADPSNEQTVLDNNQSSQELASDNQPNINQLLDQLESNDTTPDAISNEQENQTEINTDLASQSNVDSPESATIDEGTISLAESTSDNSTLNSIPNDQTINQATDLNYNESIREPIPLHDIIPQRFNNN